MNTLSVWVDESRAGVLAREGRKQYVFGYLHEAKEAVSLTMPVRLQGWVSPELHPIFQMNLPEGALLEAIRRAMAKIIGDDDLSILLATGGNQIGRNRFSAVESGSPAKAGGEESLEEILTYPDTKELFHELVNKYAIRSGVSGVQPKVLLDASGRGTLSSAGYIVKAWGSDYPQLAANEFFCMTAVLAAVMETRQMIPTYISDHPELRETGEVMMSIWEEGVKEFLLGTSVMISRKTAAEEIVKH